MGNGIKMRSACDRHGNTYSFEELQALHDRQQAAPIWFAIIGLAAQIFALSRGINRTAPIELNQ